MDDGTIMTTDNVLNLIRQQISERYGDLCRTYVRDLGELDHDLFIWHWLYASITDRMDDVIASMQSEPPADVLKLSELTKSHEAVGDTENTRWILARWKKHGSALGLY